MADRTPLATEIEHTAAVLAGHQWHHTRDTHCSCGLQLAVEGYIQHVAEQLEHIIAGRMAAALDDVDRRLAVRIREGRDDPETSREGSYFAGFLDALESARHEVRWKRPDDCLCLGVNVCSTCDDETPLSDDDPRYRCLTCRRVVDPELEPSAGAPLRCPDCHADAERDGRL